MSEYVQLKFEEKVPLLASLFFSRLVTFSEIKSYKQDIFKLYSKIQSPARALNDYFKLIDREISILGVLDGRRKEIGILNKKVEEKIKNDIFKYFNCAKKVFNDDIELLLKEIDTYTSFENKSKLKPAIEKALVLHGNKSPEIWLRAIQYEIKYGKNIQHVFTRAIRQHKSVEKFYIEYLDYEWSRLNEKLNQETGVEERKKQIKNGIHFAKLLYNFAKKNCDTMEGIFFKNFLAITDRFEFAKEFQDYVIRDISF